MVSTIDGEGDVLPEQIGGVVLANRLQRPRFRFGGLVRRWFGRARAQLLKQTERHPVASTCVLTGLILLGFLVGVAWTCWSTGATTEAASRVDPSPAASWVDPSPAASVARRAPEAAERSVAERLSARPYRRDVAKELIASAIVVNYTRRSDIATGRFLENFESQWGLLVHVDPMHLQPLSRGARWVRVLGSYRPSEDRSSFRSHLLEEGELQSQPGVAIIRIVKEDRTWKLEHIRIAEGGGR